MQQQQIKLDWPQEFTADLHTIVDSYRRGPDVMFWHDFYQFQRDIAEIIHSHELSKISSLKTSVALSGKEWVLQLSSTVYGPDQFIVVNDRLSTVMPRDVYSEYLYADPEADLSALKGRHDVKLV